MKTPCAVTILATTALLVGCTVGQRGLVLDPVGPRVAYRPDRSHQGTLLVYSAYDVHAPSPSDFGDVQRHSDYKLFSADGKLLAVVHNHPHRLDAQPARVALLPGTYRIEASSNGCGVVTVPVVIEKNAVTTVHLEGGGLWPNEDVFTQANSVRLPDGVIVGWRAAASTNAVR